MESYTLRSKEWRDFCVGQGRLGNFYYNCSVMEKKSGSLLLARRPTKGESTDYRQFGPCAFCLGFFRLKNMWPHHKKCTGEGFPLPRRTSILTSICLLIISEVSGLYKKQVLDRLQCDSRSIVLNDQTIRELGERMFAYYSSKKLRHIRETLWSLPRLNRIKTHEKK